MSRKIQLLKMLMYVATGWYEQGGLGKDHERGPQHMIALQDPCEELEI